MPKPSYTVSFQASLDGTVSAGSAGDVLIKDATSGLYVKATAAARGSRRSTGIALTSYSANGSVEIQQFGEIDPAIALLGAGSASWVRVSSTGVLERASVAGSDDVCGWVEADGTFKALFGLLTASIVNGGGGGGGTPGGSTTQVQYNAAGSFGGISGATTDGTILSLDSPRFVTPSVWNPGVTFRYIFGGSAIAANRSVTLPLLGADDTFVFAAHAQTLTNKTIAGASNTLTVRIANDVTGLGTGVATFLTTPSGANLASALTTALPVSKGGTNRTALGTALQVLRTNAGATDTEWASVSATPAGSSGDIQTNSAGSFGAFTPGSGVVTMLTTFSSANIRTACTDETGSGGGLVFATAPTISSATLSGNPVMTGFTSNASTGTLNNVSRGSTLFVEFTNATGPTVTGFDATGAVDGTILWVYISGGNVAITHEDAGSTAANRITLSSGITITCTTGTFTQFVYRSSRWRALTASAI